MATSLFLSLSEKYLCEMFINSIDLLFSFVVRGRFEALRFCVPDVDGVGSSLVSLDLPERESEEEDPEKESEEEGAVRRLELLDWGVCSSHTGSIMISSVIVMKTLSFKTEAADK